MIDAAGSMCRNVANITTIGKQFVAISERDRLCVPTYKADMLAEWLRKGLEKTGMGQAALGRALTKKLGRNIDRAAVNKMLGKTRKIAADEMLAIAEILDISTPDMGVSAASEVPVLAWVSAGDLIREDFQDDIMGVETIAGLSEGDWIALKVAGDSMDRISPPESIIVVNRADKRLVSNACYVIEDADGNATYKRYRAHPKRFEPVSTNPEHDAIFPEHDPLIVGRVRMTILRM